MDGTGRGNASEVIDLTLDRREARMEAQRRFWRVIAVVHVISRGVALALAEEVLDGGGEMATFLVSARA
jgi:hypothetical protein